MKTSRLICKIVLINWIFCQSCMAKFSRDSFWAYFSKSPHEQIVQKELELGKYGTLTIKNTTGNIVIKEWEHDSVQMKATKQASKEELLADTKIQIALGPNTVTIATKHNNKKSKTTVQYELIVPSTAKLHVMTDKGSISVDKTSASIKATTREGNININDARGTIVASSQYGTITVKNATGNIRATTAKGNIIVAGSTRNVIAKTKKGTICTTCKTVPALDTISLSTGSGNIMLAIPKKTNAEVQARTARGRLTCEHYITMKPQTVQLNKKTWARLKKGVDGTLGTGEATIKLTAGSGNIKIVHSTA